MRLVIGILAFVGAGAMALADPPPPAPTQSAAATTTPPQSAATNATPHQSATTTATPPAPVASPSHETTAAIDPREKGLRAKGYRLETRNGEKMYCRSEEVLGSRLAGRKVCGTVSELDQREHLSRDMAENAQRMQLNPTGK